MNESGQTVLDRIFSLGERVKKGWNYEDPRGDDYDIGIGGDREPGKYVLGVPAYAFYTLSAFLLIVAFLAVWKYKK